MWKRPPFLEMLKNYTHFLSYTRVEMSIVFESMYCFCLLFRSKERRIRPSNQDVFPFEEEILGITFCGETNTRTPNTKRIDFSRYITREYDITVPGIALVPRESPGTRNNTHIITYSLVAAFLFTF